MQQSEETEALAFLTAEMKRRGPQPEISGKSWKGKNLGSSSMTLCMSSALSCTFVIPIQIRDLITIAVRQDKESKVIHVGKEKKRTIPFTDDMIVYVKIS